MNRILSCLILLAALFCNCRQERQPAAGDAFTSDTVRYARGIAIERYADYIIADVRDPWDGTRLLQRYVLVERDKPLPADLPAGTTVRIPVRNVTVYSSVHAGIFDLLGEADRITGLCEVRYLTVPSLCEAVRTGRIADMGETMSPNIEKMIDIGTEVVIASPFQNNSYGAVEKTGIPIVEGADYMESHPLGRSEWIRFYGLLVGKEAAADSIFRATEQRYLALKALAANAAVRPTVFAEKQYGSTWWVSPADSYTATLFRDAGADYVFNDRAGTEAVPLSFETVLDKAIRADFWLIKYIQDDDMTYADLRAEYPAYEHFDAFKNRRIFACNTGKVPYYEESPVYPERLLKDFVRIFHPELLPDYTPRYYKPVND